jgi:phage terminase small subunit
MNEIERIRNNPPPSITCMGMEEYERYWSILADITSNGVVLKYQDRHALGLLAVSLCEMDRLSKELKVNGEAMEVQGDRHIITKKNPARDALEKLRAPVLRLMREFQMTPSSRGKTYGATTGDVGDGFDIV